VATTALRQDSHVESLWREYARTRDQGLRNILVVRNLPLVYSIANRLSARSPEPFEDLVQEGSLALIRAVEGFSPDRETRFSTYAFPIVQGAIKNYLSRKAPARFADSHLEELTAPEELERLRQQEGPDFTVQVVDRVVTEALLSRLQPLERKIVSHFFYEDLTQREISNTLARSSARVSRLLRRALEKLKQALLEMQQEMSGPESGLAGSLVDAPTGLFSHLYLERCLRREVARFREGHGQSCLALFQVLLNPAPDANAGLNEEALRDIASAVKEQVRVCDHVFRVGGDEIAVLFLGSAARTQRACERIAARALKETGAPLAVGVSQPGRDGQEPDLLISTARAAALAPA